MKTILVRVAQIAGLFVLLAMLLAICSGEANAIARPKHRVRIKHDTRAFPPSKASLLAQNSAIDAENLTRFQNDGDVRAAIQSGDLVPIGWTAAKITAPVKEQYLRQAAVLELQGLAMAYDERFNQPIIVTSATRTGQFQKHLRRWNHNAAPAQGPLVSSHLAGTTFDISRKNMTKEQTRWTESYLWNLGDAVIVEEENGEYCFHIFVKG
jgi:hypothetical protein